MNELVARLQAQGWIDDDKRYNLEDRMITYYFVKGGWCCEITDRPYQVSFFKLK